MAHVWLRIINLPILAASILTYGLGAGIADYLGYAPNGWAYILGQVIILLILICSRILFEYFELLKFGAQPFSSRKDPSKTDTLSPLTLIMTVAVLMAFTVALSYSLSINVTSVGLVFIQLAVLILLSISFIGQPRLAFSGYGELVQSLIICSLVPTFAFSIQFDDIHLLLLLTTFPLIFLLMGIRFALELESYAGDLKSRRRTLLIRLGWQRGVLFHHVLLLTAYILLAAAPLFGLAWRLIWPALLSFPVGLLEIWLVNRIALGLPPRWTVLKFTTGMTFTLPVYLMAITFWMA
jgi:1,4-dihydroxy-2-naphthoate octaprenyltransferase